MASAPEIFAGADAFRRFVGIPQPTSRQLGVPWQREGEVELLALPVLISAVRSKVGCPLPATLAT